jgi:hypothetical protein
MNLGAQISGSGFRRVCLRKKASGSRFRRPNIRYHVVRQEPTASPPPLDRSVGRLWDLATRSCALEISKAAHVIDSTVHLGLRVSLYEIDLFAVLRPRPIILVFLAVIEATWTDIARLGIPSPDYWRGCFGEHRQKFADKAANEMGQPGGGKGGVGKGCFSQAGED